MANTSSVLSEAFRLRQGVRCSLAEEDSCQGGSHNVLKVVFEDSVHNWKYELRAVKMFQHIKQTHPDVRAPSVFFKAEHPVLYSERVTVPPDFMPEQKPWSMIPEYAGDYDKYTDVGFAHGDLNAYDIMKDGDFHLTGEDPQGCELTAECCSFFVSRAG
ncbi:hypothetical protein BDV33DRAFT_194957 [Aspergillus novoparasiticus]|uniref:Aminoglycoside phosphotransferase domain-containing protein n=1 Tax=Aspergillus novoparasiticus TaxID=986946 RepID=A0A5N6EFA6_9EURO|nr:hypothetical protein BDV33DRAFT_194957 [Aspergillus novoparasiticus]